MNDQELEDKQDAFDCSIECDSQEWLRGIMVEAGLNPDDKLEFYGACCAARAQFNDLAESLLSEIAKAPQRRRRVAV